MDLQDRLWTILLKDLNAMVQGSSFNSFLFQKVQQEKPDHNFTELLIESIFQTNNLNN